MIGRLERWKDGRREGWKGRRCGRMQKKSDARKTSGKERTYSTLLVHTHKLCSPPSSFTQEQSERPDCNGDCFCSLCVGNLHQGKVRTPHIWKTKEAHHCTNCFWIGAREKMVKAAAIWVSVFCELTDRQLLEGLELSVKILGSFGKSS